MQENASFYLKKIVTKSNSTNNSKKYQLIAKSLKLK